MYAKHLHSGHIFARKAISRVRDKHTCFPNGSIADHNTFNRSSGRHFVFSTTERGQRYFKLLTSNYPMMSILPLNAAKFTSNYNLLSSQPIRSGYNAKHSVHIKLMSKRIAAYIQRLETSLYMIKRTEKERQINTAKHQLTILTMKYLHLRGMCVYGKLARTFTSLSFLAILDVSSISETK